MKSEVDVVVIGAGAAGLAAGARLHAAGTDVLVLEAAARTGGRAFTDTTTLDATWDRGCHWLHSASVNPMRAEADRLGFAYANRGSRQARGTHLGTHWASEAERQALWEAIDGGFTRVKAAGRAGRDIPATDVLDVPAPWNRMARHWLTLLSAAEPEFISTLDYAAYSDTGENYPVARGYGALVQAVAQDRAPGLPVVLSCPVTRLDWSGAGVVAETPRGNVRARCAIVCLPTTVIAEGGLAFAPALPVELAEAFAGLPLGAAEKVVFRFDREVFGMPETSYTDMLDLRDPTRPPINFVLNPFGQHLAVGQLGGDNARRLVAAGPEAMADFGMAALVDAFGADIRRHLVGTAATDWVADPLIRGAYSCALPGLAHLRARLREPLGERVLFAGEAVSEHDYSTCHGAHLTGLAAAQTALGWLGAKAA